ncbi:TadE/TadG family type IV pilus assembly protein [Actinacidiphila sp. bgisy160]|uniref:TadE/TadG family type IV pilus assembly protein n=1 Tax=Actinacidiphila sp. bgisy160 TaxID=3413796 RepID=UPI003D75D75B
MTARTRRSRDRGSASLEFLGMLPILLLVALAGVQLGLAAYTAAQAGTAARAAARMAALHDPPVTGSAAGTEAVSSWLRDGTRVSTTGDTGDSVRATATVEIPSVLPGLRPGSVTRTATMPREDDEGADE